MHEYRAGELSGGRVHLATGTLYTALDRLTDDRQVRLVSEEMVAGRVRRSYGLTEDGAAALRAGAQRMAEAAPGRRRSRVAHRARPAWPEAAFGVVFAMVLSYSLTVVTNLMLPGALIFTLTSVDSLKWLVSPVALCVVLTVAFAWLLRRQAASAADPPQ